MSVVKTSKYGQQFNVMLPPELLAAIKMKQAQVLQDTAKRIKNQEVVFQGLVLWLCVDGLGLKEAMQRAKVEKAKVIMESTFQGKAFEIVMTGEDVVVAFKSLRDAVVGDKQWISPS
jgi:hypothetical protein